METETEIKLQPVFRYTGSCPECARAGKESEIFELKRGVDGIYHSCSACKMEFKEVDVDETFGTVSVSTNPYKDDVIEKLVMDWICEHPKGVTIKDIGVKFELHGNTVNRMVASFRKLKGWDFTKEGDFVIPRMET